MMWPVCGRSSKPALGHSRASPVAGFKADKIALLPTSVLFRWNRREVAYRNPSGPGPYVRHQVGPVSLDPFNPARIGSLLSWRTVDHSGTNLDRGVRSCSCFCGRWWQFGFDAIHGSRTCPLCSIAVQGCDGQASPVAVTIRHNLQKGPTLAARVPGHTACFRKLCGNSLNLILGHIRFFQY
jgi:hypothetical protein